MQTGVQCHIRTQLPIIFDEPTVFVLDDFLSIQLDVRKPVPLQLFGAFQTVALPDVIDGAGEVHQQVSRGRLIRARQARKTVAVDSNDRHSSGTVERTRHDIRLVRTIGSRIAQFPAKFKRVFAASPTEVVSNDRDGIDGDAMAA